MLPSLNYYKLFNLPKTFDIDKNKLKNEYFELSRKYHPDLNSDNISVIKEINKGYKILKDDYLRAKYLNNAKLDKEVDKGFLLEILDLEGEIEEITDIKDIKAMRNMLSGKIRECMSNYKNTEYLVKWGYYNRLWKLLDKRELQIEN